MLNFKPADSTKLNVNAQYFFSTGPPSSNSPDVNIQLFPNRCFNAQKQYFSDCFENTRKILEQNIFFFFPKAKSPSLWNWLPTPPALPGPDMLTDHCHQNRGLFVHISIIIFQTPRNTFQKSTFLNILHATIQMEYK